MVVRVLRRRRQGDARTRDGEVRVEDVCAVRARFGTRRRARGWFGGVRWGRRRRTTRLARRRMTDETAAILRCAQ